MVQIILALLAALVLGAVTYVLYRARKNERPSVEYTQRVTIEALGELVSQELSELVRDDDLMLTSDKHFEALSYKKRTLAKALDECIYGVEKAKNVVMSHIRYIVERELPEEQDCLEVVDFNDLYLCDKYVLAEERDIKNEITG